jgi:hypothetical protein
VRGKVLDARTGEGLPAAYIQIDGAEAQTVATELDGTFQLVLPPGAYKLTFSTPEFAEQTKTITVAAGKVVALSVTLAPSVVAAKEETIEVVDTIDKRKESAMLAVRRAAPTVSDAVSSQEIARTSDSNAGDAMKRVVAVTVSNGRYVALRGLEGRYVTTLLNGVLLPSPEPDRNAVPLDLFPTSLLSTMTVYKSYSADLPGQFGGGTLAIAGDRYQLVSDALRAQARRIDLRQHRRDRCPGHDECERARRGSALRLRRRDAAVAGCGPARPRRARHAGGGARAGGRVVRELYVTDYERGRLIRFDAARQPHVVAEGLVHPVGIELGPDELFYVIDERGIHRFERDGSYVSLFVAANDHVIGPRSVTFALRD